MVSRCQRGRNQPSRDRQRAVDASMALPPKTLMPAPSAWAWHPARRSARAKARGSGKMIRIVILPCVIMALAAAGSVALAADDVPGVDHRIGVIDAAPPGGLLEALLFYGVAAATVIASLGICIGKNIVRMAVWLFIALGSVALLYFLLAATFLAAIQLMVYAGGTLILLVFGVMLTSKSPWARFEPRKLELTAAAVVCGTLLVTLCAVMHRTIWPATEGVVAGAAVADFGRQLMTTYVVPFEVAGVLLMIVMVGAAHLARQEK